MQRRSVLRRGTVAQHGLRDECGREDRPDPPQVDVGAAVPLPRRQEEGYGVAGSPAHPTAIPLLQTSVQGWQGRVFVPVVTQGRTLMGLPRRRDRESLGPQEAPAPLPTMKDASRGICLRGEG